MSDANYDIIIVGGGAAGFFAAINIAEMHGNKKILLLEQGNAVLSKVKISGGGRCNVTNVISNPKELIQFYPRGSKQLLGAFYSFNSEDMVNWLYYHGVETKVEKDGRVFPISNQSQTIIDCFLNYTKEYNIEYLTSSKVIDFYVDDNWIVKTTNNRFTAEKLIITAGGNKTIWQLLKKQGVQIVEPYPSLFSFKSNDKLLQNLAGISINNIHLQILETTFQNTGDMMITHEGISGPAIITLSGFAAQYLHQVNYNATIQINFININTEQCFQQLKIYKQNNSNHLVYNYKPYDLAKRFWHQILQQLNIDITTTYQLLSHNTLMELSLLLTQYKLSVYGKNTFKEEFVTAGGVDLNAIDFKTMQHKSISNLYFAGEILDIDGVTGGFNFQSTWTTAYILASSVY
ncbi:MAG: NAD(P)/FAD-dependent oxidoreductase [Chitinophagales bacterium]|nr:NAD(P)/FAD-dependent oxidoreductase [Chitinophagales bacterium]